jgi:hypothetical protein
MGLTLKVYQAFRTHDITIVVSSKPTDLELFIENPGSLVIIYGVRT